MPASPPALLHEQLTVIVREAAWLMSALRAVRELELASWCIGAGAVRNLVWDTLHGFPSSPPADVDVVYFDPTGLPPDHDAGLERRLIALLPGLPWEVTNQANVHHWFESYFGQPATPLLSLEEAVGTWPEFATSVGIRLETDDTLTVIAPHGLDDLFSMIVRHNPTRVSAQTYRERILQKRFAKRWPKVLVLPA